MLDRRYLPPLALNCEPSFFARPRFQFFVRIVPASWARGWLLVCCELLCSRCEV
jgi:hypothetical protein